MGFNAFCSSGYAVMVTNKDVQEVYSTKGGEAVGNSCSVNEVVEKVLDTAMATNKDFRDIHSLGASASKEAVVGHSPLKEEVVEWLLDQVEGLKLYQLADAFVIFMKENSRILHMPRLSVRGPAETENHVVTLKVEGCQEDEEYNGLLGVARKFTPKDRKLSFRPGQYSFSTTNDVMPVKELLCRAAAAAEEENRPKKIAEKRETPEMIDLTSGADTASKKSDDKDAMEVCTEALKKESPKEKLAEEKSSGEVVEIPSVDEKEPPHLQEYLGGGEDDDKLNRPVKKRRKSTGRKHEASAPCEQVEKPAKKAWTFDESRPSVLEYIDILDNVLGRMKDFCPDEEHRAESAQWAVEEHMGDSLDEIANHAISRYFSTSIAT